jgi:hypothetical protein
MAPVTEDTKRKRRGPGADLTFPSNLNARMTVGQFAYLHAVAEANDVGISAALRMVIDRAIDQDRTDLEKRRGHRSLWHLTKDFTPDPQWVARHQDESDAS